MAATQAEKQQNDVNSDKVQPDQHLNVKNTLLQNGTDKNGARGGGGLAVPKGKNTGTKNLGIDMSQYRSESGPASGGPAPGGSDSNMSEQELGPPAESALYPGASASEGPPDGAYGFQFTGRDDMHSFGPRHAFGGQKQQPPPGGPFSQHQQRFATGQSISQPTGPTPTLNQLLQSSNTVQRYQNSYGHAEQYGQGWPQKPYVPPASAAAAAPYRAQSAVSRFFVIFRLNRLCVPDENVDFHVDPRVPRYFCVLDEVHGGYALFFAIADVGGDKNTCFLFTIDLLSV